MSFVLKTVFSFEIQYFRGNNEPSHFRRKAKMDQSTLSRNCDFCVKNTI